MQKKGFTLAEALITMAVIGIVAALLLPIASKFMPDGNKALFLKTYDSLVDVTQTLTSSTELYPIVNDPNTDRRIYKHYPLYNTTATKTIDSKNYGGTKAKFCQLVALGFGVGYDSMNCSTGYSANPAWSEANRSFTANNGVEFMIFTSASENASTVFYQSDVYFDVDGFEKGNNCTYDTSTCKNPDRFKIAIASDGDIAVTDAKGQEYLRKRSNLRLNRDEGTLVATALKSNFDERRLELLPEYETGNENNSGNKNEEEEQEPERPELPAGQKYADWVVVSSLRTTFASGVYCEQHNPSKPAGDYSQLRHVYWHQEAQAWVELEGVYSTSSGNYNYAEYTGADANQIMQW